MTNKEIKQHAQGIVSTSKTTYGLALIPPLLYGFISGIIGDGVLLNLLLLLVGLCYPLIIAMAYLQIVRGDAYSFNKHIVEETKTSAFRYMGLSLVSGFFVFLWSLLLIVPGYIKSIAYAMAPFILKDNPDMRVTDSITNSQELMDGHKAQYFKLYVSYFIWVALSLIIGLGGLFILPFVILGAAFGLAVPGVVIGLGIALTLIGFLTSFILSIRVLPRWHVAQVLFYEQLTSNATHE